MHDLNYLSIHTKWFQATYTQPLGNAATEVGEIRSVILALTDYGSCTMKYTSTTKRSNKHIYAVLFSTHLRAKSLGKERSRKFMVRSLRK